MSITAELFGRWKAKKGHASDRAALAALGVSHGAAVHWRNGRNADVHIVEKMAADLGEDPLAAVARAMEEQATGADSKTWSRLAKRLGAAAAVAACALGSAALLTSGDVEIQGLALILAADLRHYAQFGIPVAIIGLAAICAFWHMESRHDSLA